MIFVIDDDPTVMVWSIVIDDDGDLNVMCNGHSVMYIDSLTGTLARRTIPTDLGLRLDVDGRIQIGEKG